MMRCARRTRALVDEGERRLPQGCAEGAVQVAGRHAYRLGRDRRSGSRDRDGPRHGRRCAAAARPAGARAGPRHPAPDGHSDRQGSARQSAPSPRPAAGRDSRRARRHAPAQRLHPPGTCPHGWRKSQGRATAISQKASSCSRPGSRAIDAHSEFDIRELQLASAMGRHERNGARPVGSHEAMPAIRPHLLMACAAAKRDDDQMLRRAEDTLGRWRRRPAAGVERARRPGMVAPIRGNGLHAAQIGDRGQHSRNIGSAGQRVIPVCSTKGQDRASRVRIAGAAREGRGPTSRRSETVDGVRDEPNHPRPPYDDGRHNCRHTGARTPLRLAGARTTHPAAGAAGRHPDQAAAARRGEPPGDRSGHFPHLRHHPRPGARPSRRGDGALLGGRCARRRHLAALRHGGDHRRRLSPRARHLRPPVLSPTRSGRLATSWPTRAMLFAACALRRPAVARAHRPDAVSTAWSMST